MNKFKQYRKIAQLTQAQVAEKLNICQATIAKWETGKALPRVSVLQQVAKLYGCRISALLEGDEQDDA